MEERGRGKRSLLELLPVGREISAPEEKELRG
jgi:hypothetical protein